MIDAVRAVLEASPKVAYGLLFGSHARGAAHVQSDVDVAIGVVGGAALTALEIGDLVSRLEQAAGCDVSLVVMHEALIPLAVRALNEGVELVVKDRAALVEQRARTIIAWLDFRPVHELCVAGALKAATRA